MEKPILFLDFDHTLFDTAQFSEWLGNCDDRELRIAAFADGTIDPPDLAAMLYPDTRDFLEQTRKIYKLVLLTYTTNRLFQEKKVRGSGITSVLDDILMTSGEGGGTGKGVAAKQYLFHTRDTSGRHLFVDDAPENIVEVKTENPDIRCIRIDRVPVKNDTNMSQLILPDNIVTDLSELLTIL